MANSAEVWHAFITHRVINTVFQTGFKPPWPAAGVWNSWCLKLSLKFHAPGLPYLPHIIIIHLFIYWLSWGRNDWKRMAARWWAVSWWISRSQRALAFNYQNPLVPLLVDLFSDGPTLNLTQRTLTISKVKPKASKKKTNRIRRFFRFRYSVVCQVI